jgi:hypothetical protein
MSRVRGIKQGMVLWVERQSESALLLSVLVSFMGVSRGV